jgi:hypothetical protein
MKIAINPDGSATITTADEGNQNPDGTHAIRTWDVNSEQLGKHLRGIADPAHPWNALSAGDKSAAADAAAASLAAATKP